MQIDLHAKVVTRDDEPAGRVEYAVIDPDTNEITQFVVGTGGLLGKDVLVPRAEVEHATSEGDVLRLRLDKDQLGRLPEYLGEHYQPPPSSWMPPPTILFPYGGLMWPAAREQVEARSTIPEPWAAPRDVLIDKGMPVLDRTNADVGVVENVLMEPGGSRIQALDVRLGGALRTLLPGGDVISLSMDLVESVEPEGVRLRVKQDELPPN